MEAGRVASWLQIVGNVGIVLGLLFVGFQLYQDRQLKLAELSASYFDARIQANIAVMGEEPFRSIVKAAYSPEAMTPEDAYIFFANIDNWMSLDMRSSSLERLGLYSDRWQNTSGLILEARTEPGLREMKARLARGNNGLLSPEYFEKLKLQVREPGMASGFKDRLEALLDQSAIDE